MDKALDFYEIDAAYIEYLSKTDAKVPKIDYSEASVHDKFLCGIVLEVNDHRYFAPISSFKTPQRTNIIIRNEDGRELSSIRFSFMLPVPPGVAAVKRIAEEQSLKYRRLLNWELQFCRKNAAAIFSRARYVYNSVVVKKDPLMVKNCCDFKALETACAEYAGRRLAKQKDAGAPLAEAGSQSKKERPSTLAQIRAAKKEPRERHESKEAKRKSDPER
jgi:protein AbiQ